MSNKVREAVAALVSSAWVARGVVVVVLAAFNLIIFNRYLPLSEGWWEAYGYLYNSGLRPYRDFDLAYTPLFTLVNAGLLRVFDDSFYALRLFGVAVLVGAVLLLQLFLERLFSPRSAAVGTLVATFLMIAQRQFIAKDYHTYQLGLVALVLYVNVRIACGGLDARARVRWTLGLGAATALVFILKQNVGALLVVAVGATLLLVERERPFARVVAFGAGALAPLLLLLPVVGPAEWRALLVGNDAKGDLSTVLLRFWREDNREVLLAGAALAVAWGAARVAAPWVAARAGRPGEALRAAWARPPVRWGAFAAAAAGVAVLVEPLRQLTYEGIIPAAIGLLFVALVQVGRGLLDRRRAVDPRIAASVLPVLALVYANTTTASFDLMALQIPVAIAIAWILAAVEGWASAGGWALAAAAFMAIVPTVVGHKLESPYTWWGLVQAPVDAAKEEPAYPQLRGMYLGPAQRQALDEVKAAVDTFSRDRRDVFFFNLPAFYWLHGKLPPYRTVVHWFDVVPSRQLDADLRALWERPPRLVVALEPSPAAYRVHREMKEQARLPQEDFRDLMDTWVADRTYRLVRSIPLPSFPRPEGAQAVQAIAVQNEGAVGRTVAELEALAGGAARLRRMPGGAGAGPRVAAGELLAASGTWAAVRAATEAIGVARGEPRDWMTVSVYVRADALAEAVDPALEAERRASATPAASHPPAPGAGPVTAPR